MSIDDSSPEMSSHLLSNKRYTFVIGMGRVLSSDTMTIVLHTEYVIK